MVVFLRRVRYTKAMREKRTNQFALPETLFYSTAGAVAGQTRVCPQYGAARQAAGDIIKTSGLMAKLRRTHPFYMRRADFSRNGSG